MSQFENLKMECRVELPIVTTSRSVSGTVLFTAEGAEVLRKERGEESALRPLRYWVWQLM